MATPKAGSLSKDNKEHLFPAPHTQHSFVFQTSEEDHPNGAESSARYLKIEKEWPSNQLVDF